MSGAAESSGLTHLPCETSSGASAFTCTPPVTRPGPSKGALFPHELSLC